MTVRQVFIYSVTVANARSAPELAWRTRLQSGKELAHLHTAEHAFVTFVFAEVITALILSPIDAASDHLKSVEIILQIENHQAVHAH